MIFYSLYSKPNFLHFECGPRKNPPRHNIVGFRVMYSAQSLNWESSRLFAGLRKPFITNITSYTSNQHCCCTFPLLVKTAFQITESRRPQLFLQENKIRDLLRGNFLKPHFGFHLHSYAGHKITQTMKRMTKLSW